MTKPIRHHYVPQTYLKNFSFIKKNSNKLFALDRKTKQIFEANINDVAVEKNFYKIKNDKDDYIWEKYYANHVEPVMAETFKSLIPICESCLVKDGATIINSTLRNTLSFIIIFQLLRGKHTRNYLKSIYEKVGIEIVDEVTKEHNEATGSELSKILNDSEISNDIFKASIVQAILDEERMIGYATILLNRTWVIYRLTENLEFITSDNPVLIMNRLTLDTTPFKNGIKNDNTVILYPISPKLIIAIYANDSLLWQLQNYTGKLIFLTDKKNQKFINIMNKKQLEQCTRQVYSISKDTLIKINEINY